MDLVYGDHPINPPIGGDRRLPMQGVNNDFNVASDLFLERSQWLDKARYVPLIDTWDLYHSSAFSGELAETMPEEIQRPVHPKLVVDDNHDGTWRDAAHTYFDKTIGSKRAVPMVERFDRYMQTAAVAATFAAVTGGMVYNAVDEWRSSKSKDISSGETKIAQKVESAATSKGEL